MDYKEEISRLQGQVANISWVMSWMLDRVQDCGADTGVLEGLVGLNNTKADLEWQVEVLKMKQEKGTQAGLG